MPAMTELEERQIRNYVASQTPRESGDEVTLVQKVSRRRVAGRKHDIYDVWMASGQRWWVITDFTNLYSQDEFQSIEQVFTYHLGHNIVVREQFNMEPDEEQVKHAGRAWRRYVGAVDAMATAEEAEDFQAVGIRCREVLLALVRDHMDASWVRIPGERPQDANAKEWLKIFANSLTATTRLRRYLTAIAEKTWDLTVWLQHYVDATELDAEIVLGATQQLLKTFTLLRVSHEQAGGQRCPECDSYQVVEESSELVERNGHFGTLLHDECVTCGWKSDEKFEQWPRERLQRLIDYATGTWSPPKKSMDDLEVKEEQDDPQSD
ncbi:hypothetical protein ACFFSW_33495 [Saccharothrix longispora]|uniref:Uncharacterized protein n=1 Tax=Saccharothrix longispora TaxID=33920 RepID=A0ABU1Q2E9_9PSEU|nr:hypothetical protein [Saccharothrix longispora]MDR6597060.1 hypothetical protein [Saccharothrix longispora]